MVLEFKMLKHYSYPSIAQFRNLVGDIRAKAQYVGKDEEGKPVFDKNKSLPTIKLEGTVKLHGANCSVVLDKEGNLYSQSRNNVLSLESDFMGFNIFVMQNKDYFASMLKTYFTPLTEAVIVYGEWCGANVQRGVALCELPKMFIAFDVRVVDEELIENKGWVDATEIAKWNNSDIRVFNTQMFERWSIEIDIADPMKIQNQLIEITNGVEKCCPVGKHFGVEGVGEGVVWTAIYNDRKYAMKIKGEKHSATKVKKLAEVDTEKLKSIDEFVNYAFTENRLNQGIEWMKENHHELEMKNILHFIKWVFGDIVKEESDTLINNGLTTKDIANKGNHLIRQWYTNKVNQV